MSYTAQQIDDAVESYDWSYLEYRDEFAFDIDGEKVTFKKVDSRFGEEGDYSIDTHIVVQVGDQFFRKTGYYRSHDGEYWDGRLDEVTPVEKLVTVYERKN